MMMMMKLDDSDRPEGQIEVLVDLGVPYVRLADYRAMQRRCADELAALKGFDPVKALALMGERDSAIRGLETARREFNRQLAETVEYYRQVNSDTEAEQLRARVAELEAAQQWRPVTEKPTEPPDGETSEYLTWNDFVGFTVRRYRDGQFHSAFRKQPTHWRPLPPAPPETA